MANFGLSPRKVVVVYSVEADGSWRRHNITVVQGGAATVTTSGAHASIDAARAAAYAANPQQTIHSEHVVRDEGFALSS